jgi:hypothetical protein
MMSLLRGIGSRNSGLGWYVPRHSLGVVDTYGSCSYNSPIRLLELLLRSKKRRKKEMVSWQKAWIIINTTLARMSITNAFLNHP